MRISDWSSDVCSSDLSASAAVAPRCGPAISPTATSRSTQITGASAVAAGSTTADRANSEGANSDGAAGESGCWLEDARAAPAALILLLAEAVLVEIGPPSRRERVSQYALNLVVPVSIHKEYINIELYYK